VSGDPRFERYVLAHLRRVVQAVPGRFGRLSRARCRPGGDRGPFGRSTARRRDAGRALFSAQSTAGDV